MVLPKLERIARGIEQDSQHAQIPKWVQYAIYKGLQGFNFLKNFICLINKDYRYPFILDKIYGCW
jgi:hypothetical protein